MQLHDLADQHVAGGATVLRLPVSDRYTHPCPGPGVYRVPSDEYHSWAALHSTASGHWMRSAARGIDRWRTPDERSSASVRLGSALHLAVLEPDDFAAKVVRPPEVDRRTKAGRAEYAAWNEDLPADAVVITPDDFDRCAGMAASIRRHPFARGIVAADADKELSVVWDDPTLGLRCKSRLDFWHAERELVVDLKTTRDLDQFGRSAATYGYHRQAAMQLRAAVASALGARRPAHLIVAVESEPPYEVVVYEYDGSALLSPSVGQGWGELSRVVAPRVRAWVSGDLDDFGYPAPGRRKPTTDQMIRSIGLPVYAMDETLAPRDGDRWPWSDLVGGVA